MIWQLSHRFDKDARLIADRNYNRQKVGTPQFVPPGRCCVLFSPGAFWVTSWPFGEYVRHRWPNAWVCSAFRREPPCEELASVLIRDALSATRWHFGDVPAEGMVTFIDRDKVQPVMVRGKKTWGRTWLLAGFEDAGETQGGLLAFHISPDRMPEVRAPLGTNIDLFAEVTA